MELPVICQPQQLHRWQRPLVAAAAAAACDVHTAATLICKASEPQSLRGVCCVSCMRGNKYSRYATTRLNRGRTTAFDGECFFFFSFCHKSEGVEVIGAGITKSSQQEVKNSIFIF